MDVSVNSYENGDLCFYWGHEVFPKSYSHWDRNSIFLMQSSWSCWFWRKHISAGRPFAGCYGTSCKRSRAEDIQSCVQAVLNHYCFNVKGFTCPHLWILEGCNTIHSLWYSTAIQRGEFARSAAVFPQLPPLPHKNFVDSRLRTVVCTTCTAWKEADFQRRGRPLYKTAKNMASSSTTSPTMFFIRWTVLLLLIKRRLNAKHR